MTEVFEGRKTRLVDSNEKLGASLEGTPAEELVVVKKSAPPATPSRMEAVLEYGHLQRDIAVLYHEVRSGGAGGELSAAVTFFLFLPILLMKLVGVGVPVLVDWLIWPVLRTVSLPIFHSALHDFLIRGLLFGSLLSIMAIYLLILLKFGARVSLKALLEPTNLIITGDGIRKQWTGAMSLRSSLYRWSALTGARVREEKKNGRHERVLELSFGSKKLNLDLHTIRTAAELKVLRTALDRLAPEGVISEDMKLLIFDSSTVGTRYTEIWSQALLDQQKRKWTQVLPPGTKMNDDKLEIVCKIGSGGQGTVYLAKRNDLGSAPQVVLKEYILPESSEAHDRRRALKSFEQEIALLGRISNERIVDLLDVFVQDQRAYLVLEYVDGPSLKQLVEQEGPLAIRPCLDYALQMCEILDCLHNQDPPIVHQDFTPDNLLVGRENHLKLVDFNVTREDLQIRTSLVVGKQSYMPPEQFKGKSTCQSDLYALGATLFFLITAQEPEALSVCHPAKVMSTIPQELDRIVARATSLELPDRYATAREMADDLKAFSNSIEGTG
ncbi:MAG: serine/threonine protein kinase [Cyanobacteria bacterium HKST-UBA02]|nr:serine/threonine protein kinase [Cyanobacteria bacterium HKST-UBA02]